MQLVVRRWGPEVTEAGRPDVLDDAVGLVVNGRFEDDLLLMHTDPLLDTDRVDTAVLGSHLPPGQDDFGAGGLMDLRWLLLLGVGEVVAPSGQRDEQPEPGCQLRPVLYPPSCLGRLKLRNGSGAAIDSKANPLAGHLEIIRCVHAFPPASWAVFRPVFALHCLCTGPMTNPSTCFCNRTRRRSASTPGSLFAPAERRHGEPHSPGWAPERDVPQATGSMAPRVVARRVPCTLRDRSTAEI